MKGIQGLVIALALAITGGVCNWLYLANQADRYERMAFVKINVDQIVAGDKFKDEHFAKVEIPRNNLGNIETIAVKWVDLSTVLGVVANRDYVRDQLVLADDLKTPPTQDLSKLIGPDEVIAWLPVDPRTFNPRQVNPGDMVSFRIPQNSFPAPALADADPDAAPARISGEEIIGPFRILALGNRRGSLEVAQARGQAGGSENTITFSVEFRNEKLEKNARRVFDLMNQTGLRGVQPLLHSAKQKK